MMRFSAGPLLFVMFANGCVIVVLCSALMGSRASLRKLQAAQKVPRAAVPVVPEAPNPVRNQVHEEDHQWGTGGKHVLAFSLFGSNTRYTVGAIENSKLYRTVYPGWSMRVYHDNSVPSDVIDKLYANGVDLVNMSASPLRAKTTWRFTAASDKTVARFCSRDTDSRLSLREKTAVDAWINSRKKFHVMRDHPSHTRQHMILAGMWCATGDAVPDMIQLLHKRSLRDYYTQDQDFLNEAIWPIAQKSVIHHDSFSCEKHANAHPFPLQRVGYEHVGSVFIDGHLRQSDVDLLKAATPPKACIPVLLRPSGFDAHVVAHRPKRVIAICACVTSKPGFISGRTVSYPHSVNKTTLQMLLIPSIERTVTPAEQDAFQVRLYLGMNDDDTFWLAHVGQLKAPAWLHVKSAAFKATHDSIPFNQLMKMAFDKGADYLVRVNDDTKFITPGWISIGVHTLEGHATPNVGVVGPTTELDAHRPGFMTHDMVHKTHLMIFKNYYPEVFSSWWVDDWISLVYEPGILSTKLDYWKVAHPTNMNGRRYQIKWGEQAYLETEIQKGRTKIHEWISSQFALTPPSWKNQSHRFDSSPPHTLHLKLM